MCENSGQEEGSGEAAVWRVSVALCDGVEGAQVRVPGQGGVGAEGLPCGRQRLRLWRRNKVRT